MTWQPTCITQFVEARESSTQVVIVETDAGRGFLKAMGNPEGEHALACDWVGTKLAEWFGLMTFEQAIISVDDIVEITFLNGETAEKGPALVSREISGAPWSTSEKQLKSIDNIEHISRLVVFDTWILNRDRHSHNRQNPDNVFLRAENGRLDLLAIDHTHCFGTRNGELTERVKHLDIIREEAVFGLFPEFAPLLNREIVVQSLQDLATIKDSVVRTALGGIPREWNVTPKAKAALSELIIRRAAFVAQSLEAKLFAQQRIEFTDQNGN